MFSSLASILSALPRSGNYMTMQKAASYAIVLSVIVSLFDKENRISVTKCIDALEAGGRGVISVAVACGVAGIISGSITMTGLANDLINGIISVANGKLIIALLLTMLCCIVLGMGVPTTANYCIMAATCAPILVRMGVPTLAAHFFVFYFGIVADITPPVALAAYAGSAIAKANPMKHVFDNYLDTAGIPDPDLMIRTSGELRLSNFLLWQMAYTEFYFTDVAWPDFNKAELIKAIEKYNQRDRRYGGVKEE